MYFTKSDGVRIGYRKEGTGPTLVLVHGTGGDGAGNWGDVTKDLSQDYTVIRPDYTGSGDTEDDGSTLSVEYFAEQVMAAVKDADVGNFAIVGFSLGAAVAVRIAADHADRVSGLILIAGFTRPDPRLRLQFELWRDLISSDHAAMARLVFLTGFSPDAVSSWGFCGVEQAVRDTVKAQNWAGMARQIDVDIGLDVSDAVAKVRSPTLVIGGRHDHMVPPSHSKALAASINNASYIELPTGHLAPMERPDCVAREIRNFLNET
ncbi:MAG: alpha/beta hydrolase [Pseudophaeobacter sp.]|uniref:alpha/beta fold hydrolase n=1 Tax=Pseudophaeobacter sp. TaxID=1971739 RepID=UPI003299AE36